MNFKPVMSLFLVNLALIVFLLPGAVSMEYTIGTGDVLKINVYENADLSTTVRVSADGTIRVPLLGEIGVQGMTVSSVAGEIETLLADGYLIRPQVDVFIEEYRSKRAIILGQVSKPGLYELRGTVTFLELLSKAGGLASEAGATAIVKRRDVTEGNDGRIIIDLDRLIQGGDTSLNVLIHDGDNVYLTKADTFYVTGEVSKPNAYSLEPGMTVIMAITRAEGFTNIAHRNRVRIIRQGAKEGERNVLENVNMDESVQAGDVIVVPERFF